MLRCRACLWRCFEALDASAASLGPQHLRRVAGPSLLTHSQQYSTATAQGEARSHRLPPARYDAVEKVHRARDEPWRNSAKFLKIKKTERKSLTRQPLREAKSKQVLDDNQKHVPASNRDPSMTPAEFAQRRRELQYLADPLELARFVKQELGKDKAKEMLQLVRMASHSMKCIVSWNHLIDWNLAQGRTSNAFKIYNDMKKRAQFPDSYTYSILLRGLSLNAHESGALEKALSVYHSMSAPNARVEPSIIHTNAVLKVCARANDLDALWGIAGKIPEKGPASANPITYSTILNAIRQNILVNAPTGETDEEAAARKDRGLVEGRRVWDEIVGRWRNADLLMEEELVCSMGRLLLAGARPRDWDDVLSLVEQTMDIPRLLPRLGTPERHEAGYPHLRAPGVPDDFKFDDDHLSPTETPARGDEFLPVILPARARPLTYASPSNNTLSMIQEACLKIVAGKAAEQYWNMLTDPMSYRVSPDVNNLNFRLRLLRQTRSSAKVVDVLTKGFAASNLEPRAGTFRIAMSTCKRDKNNHNSMRHAGQILSMMMKQLEDADAKTATMYADLAVSFPLAEGKDYIEALNRLDPVVRSLRLQLDVGRASAGKAPRRLAGSERHEAIEALQSIYAVFDKLINSDLISEEQKSPYKSDRARLSAYMNKMSFRAGKGVFRRAEEREAKEDAESKGPSKDADHDADKKSPPLDGAPTPA